jgi:hypothetical protein
VRRTWAAALLLSVLVGCVAHPVGPARTFGKYEGKATTTAQSALSAVSTTSLAARSGATAQAWGAYLSVLVSEQEDGLNGVAGTFASIQPPDARADALRDQLNPILADAIDHVTDVRIAIRRGQLADLDRVAAPLAGDERKLRDFIEAHQ